MNLHHVVCRSAVWTAGLALVLAAAAHASAQDAVSAPATLEPEPVPSETTPPTVTPPELEISDADLAADLAALGVQDVVESGPSVRISGFTDFGLMTVIEDDDLYYLSALYGETSFSVGNANLYVEGNLGGGFRSLLEVRFLLLPNGSLDGVSGRRQMTAAFDYTDASRALRWGGIMIERAWLEYSAFSWLRLRAGQWLSPFGIWNVDHGSPTIIPAARPYVIGEALIPLRQTGIEVSGSVVMGEVIADYHLTLSNGRGNIDDYQDLDSNKAVGGRLSVTLNPLGTLTLGVSGYFGRATSGDVSVGVGSGVSLNETIIAQHDEVSYAADLLWKYEGLHLQAEVLTQEVAYTDRGRPVPAIPLAGGGKVPDHRRFGAYGLLGYRLPWLTLMPFVQLQYMDYGLDRITPPNGLGSGEVVVFSAGLNVRPTPTVALKAQLDRPWLAKLSGTDRDHAVLFGLLSIAWSF